MQLLANILRNNRLAHPSRELAPPGKSWIHQWSGSGFEAKQHIVSISGGSRISPGGGANSQNCYYFSHFCRKLHENERIWNPRGGGARPWRPPLDPPMSMILHLLYLTSHYELNVEVDLLGFGHQPSDPFHVINSAKLQSVDVYCKISNKRCVTVDESSSVQWRSG